MILDCVGLVVIEWSEAGSRPGWLSRLMMNLDHVVEWVIEWIDEDS